MRGKSFEILKLVELGKVRFGMLKLGEFRETRFVRIMYCPFEVVVNTFCLKNG